MTPNSTVKPSELKLRRRSRVIEVRYPDGRVDQLSFEYLRELAEHYEANWARYLKRLDQIGYQRKPVQSAN